MDGLLNNLLPEGQGSCEKCLPRLPEMQIKKGGSIIGNLPLLVCCRHVIVYCCLRGFAFNGVHPAVTFFYSQETFSPKHSP